MSHAQRPTASIAPAPAATPPRVDLGWRSVLQLGSATFVFQIAQYFDLRHVGIGELLHLGGTWLVHLAGAGVMLRVVDRAFRRALPAPAPSPSALVRTVLRAAAWAWLPHMALLGVRVGIGDLRAEDLFRRPGGLPAFLFLWCASTAALLVLAVAAISRRRAAQEAWHETQLRTADLTRELAFTEAQLLQAQSEPHFIFNALANVRRLLHTDPPAARGLLDDLLRYLREALPSLRSESSTLGREAELVRAYLGVHQVRMGSRLQAQVDVAAALADHPVPSMVLLSLVENALKHGLQPEVGGGSVRVAARAEGGRLRLTVADTGRGMGTGSGQGTGLANLRARLRLRYGAAASLSLALNEPRGVIATVELPEHA